MDVILTAGGSPLPDEALYPATRGGYKAMLEIAGKPMVGWVLNALAGAKSVNRIVVVGLPPATDLGCNLPLTILPGNHTILANIRAAAEELLAQDPNDRAVLILSADVPVITPEMIDWLIDQAEQSQQDFFYSAVDRSSLEQKYPGAQQPYSHFKNIDICSSDAMLVRSIKSVLTNPAWEKIIEARHDPLKLAELLGGNSILFLLTRRYSIQETEKIIEKKLGISCRVILSPYPDLALSINKPHQFDLAEAELARRSRAA